MSKKCALILAAGEGRRMKTSKPKVLAEVLFKPMIDWVTDVSVRAVLMRYVLLRVTATRSLKLTLAESSGLSFSRSFSAQVMLLCRRKNLSKQIHPAIFLS